MSKQTEQRQMADRLQAFAKHCEQEMLWWEKALRDSEESGAHVAIGQGVVRFFNQQLPGLYQWAHRLQETAER